MTTYQTRARRAAAERLPPSPPGSRNTWYYADCPKHGRQVHMTVIGGRCVECQKESCSP